jgi:hypothetical protein
MDGDEKRMGGLVARLPPAQSPRQLVSSCR